MEELKNQEELKDQEIVDEQIENDDEIDSSRNIDRENLYTNIMMGALLVGMFIYLIVR